MCKYGVLGMICLINDYTMWGLNDMQLKIGELWNFLGVHREVTVDTRKEVLV